MLEFFKELISSVKSNSSERAKNYYLGAFLFSWCTINWQFILTLLFSDRNIEDRISQAKSFLTTDSVLLNPITMSVILCIGLPVINMIIAYAQNRPNSFLRNDSHQIKIKRLVNEIETETLRAERDSAYKKKSVSESLEVQTLQAQIQESKDVSLKLSEENASLIDELNSLKKELNVYITDIESLKHQVSESSKENVKLEAELKTLQNKNIDISEKLVESENRFEQEKIDNNFTVNQLLDEKNNIEIKAKQLEDNNALLVRKIAALTPNPDEAATPLAEILATNIIMESEQNRSNNLFKKVAESPTMQLIHEASNTPVSLAMREAAALTSSLRRKVGAEPGNSYLEKALKPTPEIPPADLENK